MVSTPARRVRRCIIAAAAMSAIIGCGRSDEPVAEAGAPAVVELGANDVATVVVSDLAAGIVVTGTLDPSEVVDVKAQVAGTIRNLAADRGVAVRRGQRLATIEAQAVQSQVSGARAGVAAGQSAIAAAEANVAAARQKLEGAKTLYAAGAMSAIDYRGAEAQYEAAVGQLAAAKAEAAAASAQLAGASETAGRTTIESPITGIVSERPVSEGEAVNVGQSLFTIVNSDVLELSGQVPVQQAAAIKVGQAVSFSLDAYPGQVFTGHVARIDPVADPNTRRVGIALQLPNPGRKLIAGQFVTGEVITANIGKALVIPRAALRADGSERYVLVVEGDRVARRAVTVTPTADASRDPVAIQSGVRAGERVIVSPDRAIQAGTRVRLAETPAAGQR
jgi:RND family efflux transporter MFP subunit